MTSRLLLRMVAAVPVVAMLISCGGSPTATGPAAAQQSVGDAQAIGGADAETSAGGAAEASSGQARPAPTGGGARPGGPAPGSGGNARPGGPFDVEAFENRGQDLAGFRPFGADHCASGRCVLVEQTSTDPAAQEGCEVADFAYDPPAQPAGAPPAEQFIQRGTTVTVFVHCPPAAGESGAAGSSSGESAASDSSAASAASDSSAASGQASDSSAASGQASESSSDGAGG